MRPHPAFARVYSALAVLGERLRLGRLRSEAAAEARGRVVVVGVGPGHDLRHLPPAVTEVLAVEPDPTMRGAARRRSAGSTVPVHLLAARGEALPLADGVADSVLCALVLCSVEDVAAVLNEVRRVLRPGGSLHLLEHVRSPTYPWLGRLQDRVDPLWQRLAGGCHCNRDTAAALGAAGFDTTRLVVRPWWVNFLVASPMLQGVARPR